ncbi:hypothetical protein B0O80DRAFT_427117 [Mortierella sp. GBAus27b]|nr:hypothetical protein B0O80DRAFT_427117 [Mortierella sp. GBAus27b]
MCFSEAFGPRGSSWVQWRHSPLRTWWECVNATEGRWVMVAARSRWGYDFSIGGFPTGHPSPLRPHVSRALNRPNPASICSKYMNMCLLPVRQLCRSHAMALSLRANSLPNILVQGMSCTLKGLSLSIPAPDTTNKLSPVPRLRRGTHNGGKSQYPEMTLHFV